MHRCLQLARLGQAHVAPNPMVGAVLVAEGRIIGEGYHRKYGEPHAEVNCLQAVKEVDRHLVQTATLYVSLEPCSHFGKTPPCSDLVIAHAIPRVVVGALDPYPAVNGRGIEKLKAAGIEVETGVLEAECREINRYFFHYQEQQRPYVIIKWAQSSDGFIAGDQEQRTMISNAYSNRLVHRWRSEVMAIMVGRQTAAKDDPQLTTRLWPGRDPVRVLIDMEGRLDRAARIFSKEGDVIVCSYEKKGREGNIRYLQVDRTEMVIPQVLQGLFEMNIQSVLVEGGARLLQSFIEAGTWDEARVITNEELFLSGGLPAPVLRDHVLHHIESIYSDNIRTFKRSGH